MRWAVLVAVLLVGLTVAAAYWHDAPGMARTRAPSPVQECRQQRLDSPRKWS